MLGDGGMKGAAPAAVKAGLPPGLWQGRVSCPATGRFRA